jgi:MbtH protein
MLSRQQDTRRSVCAGTDLLFLGVVRASLVREGIRVTNPFEQDDAEYVVLVNDDGQYSLWPVFAAIPPGWWVCLQRTSRKACLEFVENIWTDMRPRRLVSRSAVPADRGRVVPEP